MSDNFLCETAAMLKEMKNGQNSTTDRKRKKAWDAGLKYSGKESGSL